MKYILENSNTNYYKVISEIISNRKDEIFNFFNVDKLDLCCKIYVYDSIESLVNGLNKRGFKNNPSYMCACFKDEDNSLNFFEPKDNPSSDEWSKEEYEKAIFHELIHAIQYAMFGTIPEWLSEGIAKYLDGTYSKGIKWLLENSINNKSIPNQDEIEQEFGMHNYDSYDYAYIMISYLIETLGKDSFIELLKDKNKLNSIKDKLLIKSIIYYNNKYNINKAAKYLKQDINNPKYLFHGSPNLLSKLVPNQSHDSRNNQNNIDNAVFLFPSFLKCTPYAFKDTIKELSYGLDWCFDIPNDNTFPLMKMSNVNTDNEIVGYIYVFLKDDDMIKDDESYQYKCYKELKPIDIVEVKYKDYKQYYQEEKIVKKTR